MIVVIEDNVDAAESLVDVLALHGLEARHALDGRTGIALARELRPRVVVVDIGLPDMDGYEVARALRGDPALGATRLIALSGYAIPRDGRRSREAGFEAHLLKPPDVDELLRLVGG